MSTVLRFGRYELWPDERQFRIAGVPAAIGARAFDVLVALVERRDRVVAKDELLDRVWPGAEVEENNLSVQISALRKLLGAGAIVTLPGRGYRFVLPAEQGDGTAPVSMPSPTRPALAVLPFDAHAASDTGCGDGITEEIIAALSRNHGLFVIASSSTLRYRGSTSALAAIATELGVRYLVVGSLRRQQRKLRVGAELVEAATGHLLWADHFEAADEDPFECQARIASSIAAAVEARVEEAELASAAQRPTKHLSAYDCLLRGLAVLHSFDDGRFERAGEMLRRAIELDPRHCRAHAHLACWHGLKLGEGRSLDCAGDSERALQLSRRALELDGQDALALSVAGHLESHVARDFPAAMDCFAQALAVDPNCTAAWGLSGATLACIGDGNEARRRTGNALRLSPFDPLAFTFCATAGTACLVLGHDDEALARLARSRRLNPGYRLAWRLLVAALALAGKAEELRTQAAALLRVDPAYRVSQFGAWYPLAEPHLSRIVDGMRRGGLPD